MIKYVHDPVERAHITACALGIHLNIDHKSYGGTESLIAMVGDKVIFHGTVSQTVTFLCSLHKRVNSVLALFSSDCVDHQDANACYDVISGTVGSKTLTKLYNEWILGNESLIRYLCK